ncbi:MAG: glycosyltransferase [Candidatus Obscuribacterales bacterium]|nr:glycosyltransferase [Candidatus Obscuribacterales bacterium]
MSEYPRISVVLPAYQEAKRIGATIGRWSSFLSSYHAGAELIVVCDGCADDTASVARDNFVSDNCTFSVIELPLNRGKGAAVKAGVAAATGATIVFTDADMSYEPEILGLFLAKIEAGADVAIAQRQKDEQYPGLGRRIVAVASRFLIGNFAMPGIRDTQAGFKAFKKEVAHDLFTAMTVERFLFDLEILVIARQRNYRIEKVYVTWIDKPGSTVRIFVDSCRSARDLISIMLRKWTGRYSR